MPLRTWWTAAALGCAVAFATMGCRATSAEQVAARVRDAVGAQSAPPYASAGIWRQVQQIYRDREFRPVWLGPDGRPAARAAAFADVLCRVDLLGMRRGEYNLAGLHGALERAYASGRPAAAELAEVDLRLTALFAEYGQHLLAGRLALVRVDTAWYVRERRAAADSIVRAAIGAGAIAEMLAPLEPPHREYRALVEALAEYREIAARGGWPVVPGTAVLRPGSRGPEVEALRARLAASGDLGGRPSRDPAVYDRGLLEAVAQFQERHGLEPDGQVGPATLAALNVPVESRVKQIELNLERHRWLPHAFGDRYLIVNVPDHRLYAYDRGRQRFSMPATIGGEYRDFMPVFADAVHELIFQPENSSDRVVYRFPHRPDLHLHDTPATPVLASRDDTTATPEHGCLRVEEPARLAAFALAGMDDWGDTAIDAAMWSDDTTAQHRRVELARELPVYVVYLTAFVRDGRVHFRPDPYNLDAQALTRIGRTSSPGMICTRLRRLLTSP